MKIGDIVSYPSDKMPCRRYRNGQAEYGVCIESEGGSICIEFYRCIDGHSGIGGKYGHCWYINPDYAEILEEAYD